MENLTITLDTETARRARIEAARHGMSISSFVHDLVRERMAESVEYEGAKERYLARRGKELGGPQPIRDERHDRSGLR
jgi:plasmid stability protein